MDALKRLVPAFTRTSIRYLAVSFRVKWMHRFMKHPEIQVIIGAHTHHFFEGKWVNQTLLTGGF